MTQESVFKPVTRSVAENPRRNIDNTVSVEPEHIVPDVSRDYLKQIAEREGLHSCLPTSLLNGLIHLGIITPEQAESFQLTLTASNRDLFSKRTFGEVTLEVMAVPASTLLERVKQTLGVEFVYQVVGVGELSIPEVTVLIQQKLMKDSVLVGGDQNHAVLIVGYDQTTSVVKVIDPYQPQAIAEKALLPFIEQIKSGEPWLTVLSK